MHQTFKKWVKKSAYNTWQNTVSRMWTVKALIRLRRHVFSWRGSFISLQHYIISLASHGMWRSADLQLSHVMRKPALCLMRTTKMHSSSLITSIVVRSLACIMSTVATSEIRRLSIAGRFESYLVSNPGDRFSHDHGSTVVTSRDLAIVWPRILHMKKAVLVPVWSVSIPSLVPDWSVSMPSLIPDWSVSMLSLITDWSVSMPELLPRKQDIRIWKIHNRKIAVIILKFE